MPTLAPLPNADAREPVADVDDDDANDAATTYPESTTVEVPSTSSVGAPTEHSSDVVSSTSGPLTPVATTTTTVSADNLPGIIDTSANGSSRGDGSTDAGTVIIIVIVLAVVVSAVCVVAFVAVRRRNRRASDPFEWGAGPPQPAIENKDFKLHGTKRLSRPSDTAVPRAAYAGGSAHIAPAATAIHYFGPANAVADSIASTDITGTDTTPGKSSEVVIPESVSDDAYSRILSPVRQLQFHVPREDESPTEI